MCVVIVIDRMQFKIMGMDNLIISKTLCDVQERCLTVTPRVLVQTTRKVKLLFTEIEKVESRADLRWGMGAWYSGWGRGVGFNNRNSFLRVLEPGSLRSE